MKPIVSGGRLVRPDAGSEEPDRAGIWCNSTTQVAVDGSGARWTQEWQLAGGPWAGNPPPRVREAPAGMVNSIGLQGPGVPAWLADRWADRLAVSR